MTETKNSKRRQRKQQAAKITTFVWDYAASGLESPVLIIDGVQVDPIPFDAPMTDGSIKRYQHAYRYGELILVLYHQDPEWYVEPRVEFQLFVEKSMLALGLSCVLERSVEQLLSAFVKIAHVLPEWPEGQFSGEQTKAVVTALITIYDELGAYWDYSVFGRKFQETMSAVVRAHDAYINSLP